MIVDFHIHVSIFNLTIRGNITIGKNAHKSHWNLVPLTTGIHKDRPFYKVGPSYLLYRVEDCPNRLLMSEALFAPWQQPSAFSTSKVHLNSMRTMVVGDL